MGAYQSKPSTEKSSNSGYNDWIEYGVSSMQGWRMNQEDAHNCELDFDQVRHASLFAVYDGHGGPEVAQYCANHLPQFLRSLPTYGSSKGNLAETLKQLFLDFDASLTTPETRNVLRNLSDPDREESGCGDEARPDNGEENEDEDEDESDSEISALRAEANQPLESVLERYGGEDALPSSIKDLLEYKRRTKVGECSTSSSASTASPATPSSSSSSSAVKTATPEKAKSDDTASATVPSDTAKETTEDSKKTNGDVPSENASSTSEEKPKADGAPEEDQDEKAKTETTGADDSNASAEAEDDDEDDSDDESVQLDEDEESDSDDDDDDDEEEGEDSSSGDEDDDDDDEYDTAVRLGIPALLKEEDSEPGMDSGTTACVALILPVDGKVRLYVANAGDSRAVLCRGRAAVDLSVDHKPEDEDEKARIQAAGGTVTRDGRVNGGLNLSRALGDHNYKQVQHLPLSDQMITPTPDVTQYDLIPGADEFVVIACDGVWNSMTSQEVVDFVYDRLHPSKTEDGAADDSANNEKKHVDSDGDNDVKRSDTSRLSKICEEIFDHCLAPNTEGDGTGCDNMTCIIVRFKNLDALVKRAADTELTESTCEVESRKRAADDTEVPRNGHQSSVCAADASRVKRPKHDTPDALTTTAAEVPPVSNGQSS